MLRAPARCSRAPRWCTPVMCSAMRREHATTTATTTSWTLTPVCDSARSSSIASACGWKMPWTKSMPRGCAAARRMQAAPTSTLSWERRAHSTRVTPSRSDRNSMLRLLLIVHRYLAVAVGLLMALWCLSGFVMLYQDYPQLTRAEQLQGLEPLDLDGCC